MSDGVPLAEPVADDSQLSILLDTFERTSYPSTEEREILARQLGMTSRSVQIWVSLRVTSSSS
jgi:hypothetical protein